MASYFYLGQSSFGDNVANATYNEARIWDGVLTTTDLTNLQVAGPDALVATSLSTLPSTTPVNITASGATLDLNNNPTTIGSLAGVAGSSVTMGTGSLTVGGDNSNTNFAGAITGSGGVTKAGTGTLTLSASNSFSGGVALQNGTLRAGALNALGTTNAVTFGSASSNATLDLGGNGVQVASINVAGGASPTSQTIGSSSTTAPSTLTITGLNSSTFGGIIQDTLGAGNQTVALVVSGGTTTTTTLSGANSYSGGTSVSGGKLILANNSAAGTGNVAVSSAGAQVQFTGGITVANNFSIVGSGDPAGAGFGALFSAAGSNTVTGTLALGDANSRVGANSGAALVLNGQISGAANSGLIIKSVDSTGTVRINSTGNSYGGPTRLIQGNLVFGAANAIDPTQPLSLGTGLGINATVDLSGLSQTIGGLANISNAGINNQNIITSTGGTATLTINTANLADNFVFGGNGSATGVISGSGANALSLVKNGPGSQTLSGANTYSGSTIINAGTLVAATASASDSATGSGNVTINGGTLASAATGWISGNVSAGSGSHTIAPGGLGTIGTLTLGSSVTSSLALNANSTLAFDVNGSSNDLLALAGTLSVVGGPATIAFNTSGTLPASITLATFATSSVTAGNFTFTGVPAGYSPLVESTDIKLISGPPLGNGIWTNGVGDYKWSTANNWLNGQPSGAGYSATFDGTGQTATTTAVLLNGPQTVGTIALNTSSGGYTIGTGVSDGTLTLDNTGNVPAAGITVSAGSHTIGARSCFPMAPPSTPRPILRYPFQR